MTVPLNQLNLDTVKGLAFGRGQTIHSEFLQPEIKLFGEDRVIAVVERIRSNRKKPPQEKGDDIDDDFLIVLAAMILRASEDEVVQECLVSAQCISEEKMISIIIY